jgi:hypothetical protein
LRILEERHLLYLVARDNGDERKSRGLT